MLALSVLQFSDW